MRWGPHRRLSLKAMMRRSVRLASRPGLWWGRQERSLFNGLCKPLPLEGLTLMTATDDDTQKVPTGRDAVDRLRSQGALDGLFEQIDVGQVKMTGADGLLPALVKEALERGLAAELTEYLGYEKGEPIFQACSNARNGTTPKTVDSEVGPFEIEVPRDRAGTFTPRLVRKGQRRLDGLDAMIISLYAGGMTVRDIQHHLASTLSVELSAGTISKTRRRGR